MSIELSEEATGQATASLKRYCTEELEIELTGMQAGIGPAQAIGSKLFKLQNAEARRRGELQLLVVVSCPELQT